MLSAAEHHIGADRWLASARRERSAAEIARVTKVNGGHKLGPDMRATN